MKAHLRAFERFRGKRGLVMGLGVFGGGTESAKFLARYCSSLLVTDLRDEATLRESLDELAGLPIEYRLGEHRQQDFRDAQVVIHSPAVRPDHKLLQLARDNGAEVTMEMSLFMEGCPARTLGITGSNGKTTLALLCYEMLAEALERAQPELEGLWADPRDRQLPRQPDSNSLRAGVAPYGRQLTDDELLEKWRFNGRVWLGGNCGQPLINHLEEMTAADVVVLELSSFQLQDWHRIRKSCDVALVTNITPNHLDWHTGMDEYIHAKAAIFAYQPPGRRCVILNLDDPRCRNLLDLHPALKSARTDPWHGPASSPAGAPGKRVPAVAVGADETESPQDQIIGYSVDPQTERGSTMPAQLTRVLFSGGRFDYGAKGAFRAIEDLLTDWRRGFAFISCLNRDDLKLPGLFNWSNAAGAYAAASAGLEVLGMAGYASRALRRFRGAEHRLEYCGEVNGARCYNDSIATTPEATIAGLGAFERGVHLLLGGSDKGLSYDALAEAVAAHAGVRGVYLQGANAGAIKDALARAGCGAPLCEFSGFDEACAAAFEALQPGDVLLMSPASASFYEYAPNTRFTNFEHRGRHFKALVQAHASQPGK
ncbi:MAG: hypothetical protein KF696_08015 [Planctomycetes bacterium]|nr:hypothetical protein [Planctomycetota bacterium]MCW8135704.1 hypothetical protein [Planctomycetota bacterium]